jgi:hypothetical protein
MHAPGIRAEDAHVSDVKHVVRTIKLKVQPDDYAWLNAAAIEVNQVWNVRRESPRRYASAA